MRFGEGLEVFLTWITTVFELDRREVLIVSSAYAACQIAYCVDWPSEPFGSLVADIHY